MKLKQITCVLFLFSLLFLSPDYSYGQFEKGNKIVGGSFSFYYNNHIWGETYQRYGSFGVSPTLGYFISEKSMIGFSPNVSLTSSSSSYTDESDYQWGLGASVFYRRFIKASDKFHFFIEPNVGYFQRNNENIIDDRITMALSPGLVYLASERLWLEAKFGGIRYDNTNYGQRDDVNTRHHLYAGLSSFSSLGVFFILK